MLDYGFKIKVADLLQNPGSKDSIKFENKFTTQIENLDEKGISGIINIVSLDKNNVLVTLENIRTLLNVQCDKCGKEFKKAINISSFNGKYVADTEVEKKMDDDFEINMKDESIDVEELVYQSIIMSDSIISICEECISKGIGTEDDPEEYDENFGTKVTIKNC